ncbi:unnamed protein product, partial [Effrenium voratum]
SPKHGLPSAGWTAGQGPQTRRRGGATTSMRWRWCRPSWPKPWSSARHGTAPVPRSLWIWG